MKPYFATCAAVTLCVVVGSCSLFGVRDASADTMDAKSQIDALAAGGAALDTYHDALDSWYLRRKGYARLREDRFLDNRAMNLEAVDLLEQAMRLTPECDEVRLLLALSYIQARRHADAIRSLEHVSDAFPRYGEACLTLARAYGAMASTTVVSYQPGKPPLRNADPRRFLVDRGQEATDADRARWVRAGQAWWRKARDIDPLNPCLHYVQASLLRAAADNKAITQQVLDAWSRYVHTVTIDAWNWRTVATVVRPLEASNRDVNQEVKDNLAPFQETAQVLGQITRLSTSIHSDPPMATVMALQASEKALGAVRLFTVDADWRTRLETDMLETDDARQRLQERVGPMSTIEVRERANDDEEPYALGVIRPSGHKYVLPVWDPASVPATVEAITLASRRHLLLLEPTVQVTELPMRELVAADLTFTWKDTDILGVIHYLTLARRPLDDVPSVCHRLEITRDGNTYTCVYTLRILYRNPRDRALPVVIQ